MCANGARSPRCAHRSLDRDVWIDAGVHQRDQAVYDLAAYAGTTARQAVDLEHHDEPDHGVVQRLAHAGRMRPHQRTLQCLQILARDPGRRQEPESCIDPVDGASLGNDALDGRDAGVDGVRGAGGRGSRGRARGRCAAGRQASYGRVSDAIPFLVSWSGSRGLSAWR